jgi:formyltetrahydrofolate deformylase
MSGPDAWRTYNLRSFQFSLEQQSQPMHADRRLILTLSCPDRVGIVAQVSTFLAQHSGWILEANHHAERAANLFFMRQEILASSLPFGADGLAQRFAPIAQQFGMQWQIRDTGVRRRVMLFVSKLEHCLYDLLGRFKAGELDAQIVGVISNHRDFESFVQWHGLPFHYVPVTAESKASAFAQMERIVDESAADALVLARYMQIVPPALCEKYAMRIINIHHSFLPSFVGAKPYQQAWERGVKLVGATSHYVTAELDAGPIIDQDVIRVDHSDTVDDLVRYGKDVEKAVLARALRYHLEDRVLVHGNKTVVFR